jgi:hypothetical protein
MVAQFDESDNQLLATPIRELGLAIEGSRLEPLIGLFRQELREAGIVRLQPDFYLSTEWGVSFGTISIGIPFYLARHDLIALHEKQTGYVEGSGRGDLLRYLRHEMGHVVNYAYRLYTRPDWSEQFGSMEKEYLEEYRPEPFCLRYVRHLPGWYAQKHPDEDWAETFAVWMTPRYDWRSAYSHWPAALTKLAFCERTMEGLNERDPDVTTIDRDEDVSDLTYTLQAFYDRLSGVDERGEPFSPGLDGALQSIFEAFGDREDVSSKAKRLPAANLIRRMELDLVANVYRWTGHFPERTRPLLRHLAERAEQLNQAYPADCEAETITALTTLVTVLAMNHVLRGSYMP